MNTREAMYMISVADLGLASPQERWIYVNQDRLHFGNTLPTHKRTFQLILSEGNEVPPSKKRMKIYNHMALWRLNRK